MFNSIVYIKISFNGAHGGEERRGEEKERWISIIASSLARDRSIPCFINSLFHQFLVSSIPCFIRGGTRGNAIAGKYAGSMRRKAPNSRRSQNSLLFPVMRE